MLSRTSVVRDTSGLRQRRTTNRSNPISTEIRIPKEAIQRKSIKFHYVYCDYYNDRQLRVASYLVGAKREKFFICGIIPERLLKETFLQDVFRRNVGLLNLHNSICK